MAGYFTQERRVQPQANLSYLRRDKNGKTLDSYTYPPTSPAGGIQVTTSWRADRDESHVKAKDKNATDVALMRQRGNAFDNGHEFTTEKRISFLSHKNVFMRGRDDSIYTGSLTPWKSGMPQWADIPPIDEVLYGQRAISATIPTKPVANLAGTFGELYKDGLPDVNFLWNKAKELRVLGSSTLRPTRAELGSEYLNWTFAWLPLQADVMKIFQSVLVMESTMRQYERDSGKVVRRNMKFPVDERILFQSNPLQTFTPYNNIANNKTFYPTDVPSFWLTRTDSLREQYWFRGAYTYYLENISTPLGQIKHLEQVYNKLLGSRVTPEVFYNLIPWSWLVDWFGNIGGTLANVSSFLEDSLVLKYGYLMRQSTADRVYSLDTRTNAWYGEFFTFQSVTHTFRTVRKERKQATPFGGFAPNGGVNTPRQWAILAALGMTGGQNKLR